MQLVRHAGEDAVSEFESANGIGALALRPERRGALGVKGIAIGDNAHDEGASEGACLAESVSVPGVQHVKDPIKVHHRRGGHGAAEGGSDGSGTRSQSAAHA